MATTLTIASRKRSRPRRWPAWMFFLLFLLVAFESIIFALVFKGTLLVLLAPGAVCWMKAMEIWKQLRKELKPL